MEEWQPIETAPKDGTRILLCFTNFVGSGAHEFLYGTGEPVGYWRRDGAIDVRLATEFPPLYWMPLPKPKSAQS